MATGLASWSQTAASNATADANINWAEGQAPSSVNDSARAMMASLAKWRDDNAGTLTTGGTSTAYTLTTNQVFGSLAAMNGQSLRVKFNATNGASPTLNVDSLGAKAIATVAGTAVGTATLVANCIYDLVYDNSNNCFVLIAGQKAGYLDAPSGTLMLFHQTAAPSGWTKDTSHNNKALRLVNGTVSSGGSSPFTTALGSRTIAQANLPNVNFTVTDTRVLKTSFYKQTTTTPGGGGTFSFFNNDAASDTDMPTTGVVSGSISAASGGSGTAMDFAVQYVDVIIASKD